MLRNTFAFILTAGALATGCVSTEEKDSGDDTQEASAEASDEVTWSFTTSWTDDCTLSVEIAGGTGSYNLGMAETAAGDAGWYGEDCSTEGACHPIDASLTLDSVHPDCGGGGIPDVVEGSTTLFKSSLDSRSTYAIFDADYALVDCAGDDCSYFE